MGQVSKIYFILALIFLGIAFLFFVFLFKKEVLLSQREQPPEIVRTYHLSQFFKYAKFIEDSIDKTKSTKIDLDKVLGGIAPHHIPTAIPLLADFYLKLKDTRDVQTFIILGPDHMDIANGKIAISKAEFLTPFGKVLPDLDMIAKLETSGFVTVEEKPFEREHSIDSQLLFISKLFPNAKVVPLILRPNATIQEVRSFGKFLTTIAGEGTFVVASVDFSHGLSEERARPVDNLSANVLRAIDSKSVELINSDSNPALAALIAYLKEKGANYHFDLKVSNTKDFGGGSDYTTGYLTGFFGIKNALLGNKDSKVTLLFVGDIMLSRWIGNIMARKNDWKYPFLKIADFLKEADLTIGNLEGPISSRGVKQGGIYSFRADPRAIEGLLYSGFDILSLANNHILDWGEVALSDTIEILNKFGIATVGAGRNFEEANAPKIIEIGGIRVAFFAYTNLYPRSFWATSTKGGVSTPTLENIKESIAKVRKDVNFIVLLWHWGKEYQTRASPNEKALAYELIDAGADIIIGHHPHVIQETQEYKHGFIAYSLGNFVFDQNFSKETSRGLVLKITLQNDKISKIEKFEVRFNSHFQPFLP